MPPGADFNDVFRCSSPQEGVVLEGEGREQVMGTAGLQETEEPMAGFE